MAKLLDIEDLRVTLPLADAPLHILRGVDLYVDHAETLGVVGESGCGKSMTALAIMGLLPRGARRTARRLSLAGEDLAGLPERRMRDFRGRRIGMIFQDPGTALNPVQRIGRQLESVWVRHHGGTRAQSRDRAVMLLERIGVRGAAGRLGQYPHELSGGLRQRVMIAMTLMAGPQLLLADEPTAALDVTVQARVLNLLRALQDDLGIGMLLITHDLGVVATVADRVTVMYAGEVVESGSVAEIMARPAHPYTARLIACVPDLSRGGRLGTIPGQVPAPTRLPQGCTFAPRCTLVLDACRAGPVAMHKLGRAHAARCLRAAEVAGHA